MSDPIQHIGADQAVPAEPDGKKASHPKHAKLRPRREWEKAVAETIDARAELQAATAAHRRAEIAEGNALADFMSLCKPPSQLDVTRAHLARSQAERAKRAEAGLDPDARAVPVVNRSKIDQHALARGKAAARSGVPLLSNVVRR